MTAPVSVEASFFRFRVDCLDAEFALVTRFVGKDVSICSEPGAIDVTRSRFRAPLAEVGRCRFRCRDASLSESSSLSATAAAVLFLLLVFTATWGCFAFLTGDSSSFVDSAMRFLLARSDAGCLTGDEARDVDAAESDT